MFWLIFIDIQEVNEEFGKSKRIQKVETGKSDAGKNIKEGRSKYQN